jgi:hypothetical protein
MVSKPNDRDAKRERFAGSRPSAAGAGRRYALIAIVALAVIALGAGAALAAPRLLTPSAPTAIAGPAPAAATLGHDPYPEALADHGSIRLPADAFADGVARHYTYMHEGQPIEFFVVRSSDGVIRAAFNACDDCYPGKRGYWQDGDEMVCGLCGNRFPTDQINIVRGGCNPAPLRRALMGELVVIRVADLVAGARFF